MTVLLLPDLKIKKYSKKIFNKYDIFYYDTNYKKRKNKKQNYSLNLECKCSAEELENFIKWFEDDLNNGTNIFNSDFELIRPDIEMVEDFKYKFQDIYKYNKVEGDNYSLSFSLIRLVEPAPVLFIELLNSLYNFQKTLLGENIGYDAHVVAPLIYQQIGTTLLNFKSMTEVHPNDYNVIRTFN